MLLAFFQTIKIFSGKENAPRRRPNQSRSCVVKGDVYAMSPALIKHFDALIWNIVCAGFYGSGFYMSEHFLGAEWILTGCQRPFWDIVLRETNLKPKEINRIIAERD